MKKRADLIQNEKEQQSNGTEDEAVKTMSPITEGIAGIREGVKNECDIAGAQRETGPQHQQENNESKARQRWRGACKLALHELHSDSGVLHKKSDKGASGTLHSHLGPIPERPSEQDVPELFIDSEAEHKSEKPVRKTSKGVCKLGVHRDTDNTTASVLDASDFIDASEDDIKDWKSFDISVAGPSRHPSSSENANVRNKWNNACKLVLHTGQEGEPNKENGDEEVFGVHTRPVRVGPKIQIDSGEEGEETEVGSTSSGPGRKKSSCRLILNTKNY